MPVWLIHTIGLRNDCFLVKSAVLKIGGLLRNTDQVLLLTGEHGGHNTLARSLHRLAQHAACCCSGSLHRVLLCGPSEGTIVSDTVITMYGSQ